MFGLTIALVGCQFLPAADNAVRVDVWNRSADAYVLRLGPDQAGHCFNVLPGTLGNAYSELGETIPRLQLYTPAGEFITTLVTSNSHPLFVLADGGNVTQFALKYRQGPGPVYDLPEIPELDGRRTPESLPRTALVCGSVN